MKQPMSHTWEKQECNELKDVIDTEAKESVFCQNNVEARNRRRDIQLLFHIFIAKLFV